MSRSVRRRVLCAFGLLLCCGVTASLPSASGADAAFGEFVDRYFAAAFAFSPSEGTANGFHEFDGRLDDLSKERVARRIEELKAQKAELAKIDRAALSADDAIDAEVLDGQIRSKLLTLETMALWRVNPMLYAGLPGSAIDGLMKRSFAPPPERLRSVIARLRLVPRLVGQAKANLENPPRAFTELAIRMAKGSVGFFKGSVGAWGRDAAGSDAALLQDFEAANTAAAAAFADFAGWLEADLLPRSRGDFALGEANYRAYLDAEEQIRLTPAELLERAERQLARDREAFIATARLIDASRTPAEVAKHLTDEHPTADDLVAAVRRSIETSRQFVIDRKIVTVPSEVRPRIEETPPYARSGSFASMDMPGPYETRATEAFYYVTPVEPEWTAAHKEEHLRAFNLPGLAILNAHEAFPGHFLQFLYAPRFPTKTRKLVYCNSNVEGWAHYTEQMMVDEGFGGGDPKVRLAQLLDALLRDCRFVVSVKLHTAGWTVAQGAKVFEEMGFQEPANAFEEARRGTYDPRYLVYTFGKLEIQKLRADFQERTGQGMRAFHDRFVAQGGLPLPLMRRVLLKE